MAIIRNFTIYVFYHTVQMKGKLCVQ